MDCASVMWSPRMPVSGEMPVITGGGGIRSTISTWNALDAALTLPDASVAVAVKS